MKRRVSVRVPATTANLGPGFDCLGMALDIHNTVSISLSECLEIRVSGEGSEALPRDASNVAYLAAQALAAVAGVNLPPVCLTLENDIPLARGLGSSAAAIVGALVAADAFLNCGMPLDCLLKLACDIEGHPDNAAPALLGGCIVVVKDGASIVHAGLPVPADLQLALFIPDFNLPTAEARRVLPRQVDLTDAVFNVGRAALLAAALASGETGLLRTATQDVLHQPYRKSLVPGMDSLFEAALDAGALGVYLSGAGPTILALAQADAGRVARAMEEAARLAGLTGRARLTRPSLQGAHVVETEQE